MPLKSKIGTAIKKMNEKKPDTTNTKMVENIIKKYTTSANDVGSAFGKRISSSGKTNSRKRYESTQANNDLAPRPKYLITS